jgi:uncharacterized membrane protein
MRGNGTTTLKWISGIVIGGGLMYLADPDRGKRRRALAREKVTHGKHVVSTATEKALRDLRNRARGMFAQTWGRIRPDSAGDEILIDRVRTKLGRAVSHPNSIEVSVQDGRVTLSGPVLEREADDLIDAVASVRGVRDVVNRLETHPSAENVPGLQGKSRSRSQRPELLQEYWAPGTRLLVGLGGALALAFPARNRRAALPGRITGGLLLARSLTNLPFRRMFGLIRSRRAIRFQKTITIHEPVERVFELWSNPENFARVMSHVQKVEKTGDNRFRWTVIGPAGTSASWESHIIDLEPNQLLAWRSVPGSLIRNAGIIRFQSTENGGTRIHLLMSYNPPAGAIGHALATLFGVGPKNVLNEDMPRLKSIFEQGKTTAHGETVTREQLSA